MSVIYDAQHDPWEHFLNILNRVIARESPRSVCDIGGGSRPVLSLGEITQAGFEYTLLDVSSPELGKTPREYKKICADISAADLNLAGGFDLMFSRMLAEHIRDAGQFHANVYRLLAAGGVAVHFFPTLYALPFIVNRLAPESVARVLFNIFARQDPLHHAKFHAYYRWCRGPTVRQMQRFTGIGFDIQEYWGFFGHGYYRRVPVLRQLHQAYSRLLERYPNPHLTSFAIVVLRKPSV